MMRHAPRPRNTAHDLPRKTIFIIVGVAAVGIVIGMLLIMPHYGPREPRRRHGGDLRSEWSR